MSFLARVSRCGASCLADLPLGFDGFEVLRWLQEFVWSGPVLLQACVVWG